MTIHHLMLFRRSVWVKRLLSGKEASGVADYGAGVCWACWGPPSDTHFRVTVEVKSPTGLTLGLLDDLVVDFRCDVSIMNSCVTHVLSSRAY